MIYAVLAQYLFCCDFRTFVWSKNEFSFLVCGAKMTNIMFGSPSLPEPDQCKLKNLKSITHSLRNASTSWDFPIIHFGDPPSKSDKTLYTGIIGQTPSIYDKESDKGYKSVWMCPKNFDASRDGRKEFFFLNI